MRTTPRFPLLPDTSMTGISRSAIFDFSVNLNRPEDGRSLSPKEELFDGYKT